MARKREGEIKGKPLGKKQMGEKRKKKKRNREKIYREKLDGRRKEEKGGEIERKLLEIKQMVNRGKDLHSDLDKIAGKKQKRGRDRH